MSEEFGLLVNFSPFGVCMTRSTVLHLTCFDSLWLSSSRMVKVSVPDTIVFCLVFYENNCLCFTVMVENYGGTGISSL